MVNWVKAKNKLWKLDGSADDVQIQAAIDYLTAGRTRQEWVTVRGDVSVNAPIEVADYTGLDMLGARFELDANVARMFESQDYNTGQSRYCGFLGGWFDGNLAARNQGCGFEGSFCDSTFTDLTFKMFEEWAIHLEGFPGSNALANQFTNCWFGTSIGGTGSALGGVWIDHQGGSAGDHQFVDCFFINNSFRNLKLDISHNNKFLNCHFAGTEQLGVGGGEIISVEVLDSQENGFLNCHWEYTDKNCIWLHSATYHGINTRIIGCDFKDPCYHDDETYDCIFVDSSDEPQEYGTIIGCTFMSNEANKPRYAIHLDGAGSNYWSVVGNSMNKTGYTGGIQNDGANNEVAHNAGA